MLTWDKNRQFFVLCDLEIWWMTLKKNTAPLLCYFKLYASFGSYWWIQTEVTVPKCSIWVKISDFLSCVTLKFDGWLSKTKGHLFYVASSFVHHFIAISEFKLKSGNAQFGNKSAIFCPVWPWYFTDDLEKQQGTSSMLLQAFYIGRGPEGSTMHPPTSLQNYVFLNPQSVHNKKWDVFDVGKSW